MDTLYGNAGDDTLLGGEGDDQVLGGEGSDLYVGGAGNDSQFDDSATSNDTYRYSRGDGSDIVTDGGGTADRLEFAEGIAASDVTVTSNGVSLILRLNTGETLTLNSVFGGAPGAVSSTNVIETVAFADGPTWSMAQMVALAQQGTVGNDNLYGLDSADSLDGGEGNDNVYGQNGNDTLAGGNGGDKLYGGNGDDVLSGDAGMDYLYGDAGNDTLLGGADSDQLFGGEGNDVYVAGTGTDGIGDYSTSSNDTYRYSRGDGSDGITDYGGAADRLEFAEGIAASDVSVSSNGTGLVLRLSTGETITLHAHFNDLTGATYSANVIETVAFADGTTWNLAQMQAMALQGTAGNDTLYGFDTADSMIGGDGNDYVYGLNGNDTLAGGNGNDTLGGGNGDDSLSGDAGLDSLNGGAGNDTLYGGADNDQLAGSDGADVLSGDAGVDILYGGAGDDTLLGGEGNDQMFGDEGNDIYVGGAGNDSMADYSTSSNDVYRFGRGDGADVLTDNGGSADRIEIGSGVTSDQLTQTRSGNNLVLGIAGTADTLTIMNWYANAANRIEEIRLTDGGTVTPASADGLTTVKFSAPSSTRTTAWRGTSPETDRQAALLIESMAQFAAPAAAEASDLVQPIKQPLPMVAASEWWLSK